MVNSGTVSFPTIICQESIQKMPQPYLFSHYTKFTVMCRFGTLVKISMCHLRFLCAMARDLAQKNVARLHTLYFLTNFLLCFYQMQQSSEQRMHLWGLAIMLTTITAALLKNNRSIDQKSIDKVSRCCHFLSDQAENLIDRNSCQC